VEQKAVNRGTTNTSTNSTFWRIKFNGPTHFHRVTYISKVGPIEAHPSQCELGHSATIR
jgi:hypothetical protein